VLSAYDLGLTAFFRHMTFNEAIALKQRNAKEVIDADGGHPTANSPAAKCMER